MRQLVLGGREAWLRSGIVVLLEVSGAPQLSRLGVVRIVEPRVLRVVVGARM